MIMDPDSLDLEDAWSYSFPPSTDSLPLSGTAAAQTKNDVESNCDKSDPKSAITKENIANGLSLKLNTKSDVFGDDSSNDSLSDQNQNGDDAVSDEKQLSLGNEEGSSNTRYIDQKAAPIDIKANQRKAGSSPNFPCDPSQQSSYSSSSLATPLYTKSTPANPQTTKEDVNSTFAVETGNRPSVEDLLNSDSVSLNSQQVSSPVVANGSNFFTAVRSAAQTAASSISSLKNNSPPLPPVEKPLPPISKSQESNGHRPSASSSTVDSFNLEGSPKILSYRKSRGSKNNSISSPILDKEKATFSPVPAPGPVPQPSVETYDKGLYVDEKYMDSHYRYATIKRNTEFHQTFKSLDLTDRLLDDFSCAISREILLHGRLYVSENNICFNSNLLGWVTTLEIPQSDIIGIEKKVTAGIFPNAITIDTKSGKHTFATFASRDSTYDFITTVWSKATRDLAIDVLDNPFEIRKSLLETDTKFFDSKESDTYSTHSSKLETEENEQKLQSYILSIDSESESDDSIDYPTISPQKSRQVEITPGYKNHGPTKHEPTDFEFDPEKNKETLLETENFDAPPGLIFDILFGENIEFHKTFLEEHDGSEISEYGKFTDLDGKPERNYTYIKYLGYSVGPKSTKCEVSEVIENLNYDKNIHILSTTVTPNVPSGNAFSVKTRYIIAWGEDNTSKLQLSYHIKWTGTSWIKGMIEKTTLSGQQTAAKDIVEALRKKVSEINSQRGDTSVAIEKISSPRKKKREAAKIIEEIKEVKALESSVETLIKSYIVSILGAIFFLLLVVIIIQWKIFLALTENNRLIRKAGSL